MICFRLSLPSRPCKRCNSWCRPVSRSSFPLRSPLTWKPTQTRPAPSKWWSKTTPVATSCVSSSILAREKLEVYFAADAPPPLLSGSRIRGRGKRIDNVLLLKIDSAAALAAGASGDVQVLSLSTMNTFGAQSTAVLLVNFFDDTSTPFTLSDLRNAVFTTVSNFDLENSQNQTWLTGDVFGWFTLPISVTTCSPYLDTFAAAAQQAATAAGVNLSSYNRFVYVFPHNACFWEGEATIGGTPSQALINGLDKLEVIGHEMGHNFGLNHSHSWDCGGTTLGTNCQMVEYGDLFDIMGDVTASHFNAFQKERLGWLNYGISQPITSVTSGGVYSITPYESGAGVKALKVLRSTDSSIGLRTWYYIEYRQLIGFDAPLSVYPTATTGVLIHSGAEGDPNSSLLLNMNPQSGFENAALGVGEIFVDVVAGVTITTKSADASGASVDIEFGPGGCHVSAPLVTVSPSQTPPVSAGSTQSLTISVTNQDTPGCNPASLFLLSTTVPPTTSGWTALLGVSSLYLSPGATASTTLQVTSPVGTPAGSYQVGVSAVKWPMYYYLASATATYVVSGVATPDFAIAAPASASVQQGSSAAITVTSTVSYGFSAPVSLSVSGLPTGLTATFTPATFAAPGSGMSTLTFNAAGTAIAGSYALTIAASGGGISHLAPVTLAVTLTLPPPPPPPSNSYSLFSSTATPDVLNANAGGALDLGMKFTADRNGYVAGIRFYKGTGNTGTHVASLWTSTGQLLAQAAFTNETASGWQQVNFASPVAITANTVYLVSYHSPSYYSYTLGTFNLPVDNPPLHAVLNSIGGNGVYSYGAGSIFPTTSADGANFWVDAAFTTGASTASLTSIAVTPANPSIGLGSTQQFVATGMYSDNSTRDITGQVTWTSAIPSVASIASAGLATGVAVGSSVISATQGTISGTTTLAVTSAPPPPPPPPSNSSSLFSSTATPDVLNANAGGALDLGMKFTADRNGYVAGIRFYKGTGNTGTHVASLWTSTGQLLAQAAFTNETASGWQQVNFASPVAITANTVYLVSYHSPSYYSYTLGTFNSPVDNPPLHAVLNSIGGNGVYSYGAGSIFPTTSADGANFWVDVVFE